MPVDSKKRKATIAVDSDSITKRLDAHAKRFDTMEERMKGMEEMLAALAQKLDERGKSTSFDPSLEGIIQASDNSAGGGGENDQEEEEESSDDDEASVVDECQKWTDMFLQLRQYRKDYGDCKVPQKHKENPKLGKWVGWQRMEYNNYYKKGMKSCLSPGRIMRLDSIGFCWGQKYPAPPSWDDMFEQMVEVQGIMGSVPHNKTNPSELAKWVAHQRYEYKRFKNGLESIITMEQIKKLKGIGFKWKGPKLW